jgi:hypothetical protein
MWNAWERREKCTRFWWESPKERDHSGNQALMGDGIRIVLVSEIDWRVWIGFDWLRIGSGGELL